MDDDVCDEKKKENSKDALRQMLLRCYTHTLGVTRCHGWKTQLRNPNPPRTDYKYKNTNTLFAVELSF